MENEVMIKISEEHCMAAQKSWYELKGLENIVKQFGSDTAYKPDEDRYKYAMKMYIEALAYHDMLFNEIIRLYLGEDFKKYENYHKTIDFYDEAIVLKRCTCTEHSCSNS